MDTQDQIKKWVTTWKKAEVSLNLIRNEELRAKHYYSENREIINSMLQFAFDHHVIRKTSGLVVQQRLFKKYYSSKMVRSL